MRIGIGPLMATLACILILLMSGEVATAEGQDAAKIQELQKQLDALAQELAKVSATNPQAQQQAMQSHWSMMQAYMQSMRQWPGMNPSGPSDWVMMSPEIMGGGTMGWYHGTGREHGWAPPPNETPARYQKHMQALQRQMRKETAAIAAEIDPTKRDALIRRHYYTVYRDMQTMRGMGWMWNRDAASALPDASSPGARLETKYCSQCHAPPLPDKHTAKEWADVTGRMQQHITEKSTTNGGVMVPSSAEMTAIVDYLDGHAKPGT